MGTVTSIALGAALITASYATMADTVKVTVQSVTAPSGETPSAPSGAWTNEPAGFTKITEHSGDTRQPSGWWLSDWAGNISTISDASAPFSRSNVLQFRWPQGSVAGEGYGLMGYGWGNLGEPGNLKLPSGAPVREIFVGFYQKHNDGWQQNDAWQTKLFYIYQMSPTGYRHAVIPYWEGPPRGPLQSMVQGFGLANMYPNRTNVPLIPGKWHKWELYVKVSSGTAGTERDGSPRRGNADGIVRWWIDGVLVGDHTGLRIPPTAFTEFHLDPIWGGGGGVKQKTDYLWFDHIYISGR